MKLADIRTQALDLGKTIHRQSVASLVYVPYGLNFGQIYFWGVQRKFPVTWSKLMNQSQTQSFLSADGFDIHNRKHTPYTLAEFPSSEELPVPDDFDYPDSDIFTHLATFAFDRSTKFNLWLAFYKRIPVLSPVQPISQLLYNQ